MFNIDKEQQRKIKEWTEALPEAKTGAIGGRLTYSFTPTGLGVILKIKDNVTEVELDVTDYDSW